MLIGLCFVTLMLTIRCMVGCYSLVVRGLRIFFCLLRWLVVGLILVLVLNIYLLGISLRGFVLM